MVHGKNRISYWIDRRLTGLADLNMMPLSRSGCSLSLKTHNMGNPGEYDAIISFGMSSRGASMRVRELEEHDALQYRALRLRALMEHPTAFSSSYEELRQWSMETFARRLRTTFDSADSFTLGCFVGESLIGTVGLYREEGPKRMHRAVIVGMHVAAEWQGKGYGRALLTEALGRARQMTGLVLISLAVESTNEPARSLYASIGFETYGIERHALFVDGEFFGEELMALKLD